jgi:hypothetical protein
VSTITISAADVATLAELARLEALAHEPRTPARRVAAALHTALISTKTIDGAKTALAGFAAPAVVDDALQLLHRLAITLTAPAAQPAPEEFTP